ncbi:MAG: hypothetical protein M1815_006270 [Lichina confinis]|nr:MAG: hypothetical protein M1815_006270 [Lichina confinis]
MSKGHWFQAPKSNTQAAKQKLVLSYFHQSGTAHNIKDLEKALPSIASINGMQVKDYLQALSDEGKIRVEKIGSGNWYWSFLSEEKRTKEKMLAELKQEKEKVAKVTTEVERQTQEATTARDEDPDGETGHDRRGLTRTQETLRCEVDALKAELGLYKDNDPMELEWKKEETRALRASAHRWTDNIYSLEGYYLDINGRDYQALAQLQQMLYGSEYQEGQGLIDL